MESQDGAIRMKYLIALSLIIAGFNVGLGQELYVTYSVPQAPIPVVQTIVYQPQAYTVMVPVVVIPQPLVSQQQMVYYPTVVAMPQMIYPHWTRRHTCWGGYRY